MGILFERTLLGFNAPRCFSSHGPVGARRMALIHYRDRTSDEFGIVTSKICCFTGIVGQVVEFHSGVQSVSNRFPTPEADGLNRFSFMQFPVEVIAIGNRTTLQVFDER